MAELDSEDSSDCVLIIDEPHDDSKQIKISNNSDSDIEIVESDEHVHNNPFSLFNCSSSPTKIGSTCKRCSRIFTTNNDLLNHMRKFSGRNCKIMTNIQLTTTKTKAKSFTFESSIKMKQKILPKSTVIVAPILKPAVPETTTLLLPQRKTVQPNHFTLPTVNNMLPLPSLSRVLIDEIEPEYTCTKCGQIFRHNIGLICHLNSEHSEVQVPSQEVINSEKNLSPTTRLKRKYIKKNKDNIQIENNEPVSDTINLTLTQDLKKDSLLSRMKSYVYCITKEKVICILCNINFKTYKKALAHVEDKHVTDKIECGYCNMKFVYELKLRSHMAKRHKVIGVYKCDKCSKMINREESDSHKEKCKGKANPTQIKREKDDN